jgi:hypothetical protein
MHTCSGLVSAAKMVADGVEDLLEAANAVVSGGQDVDLSKVDRLRAVAQSINASTIQVRFLKTWRCRIYRGNRPFSFSFEFVILKWSGTISTTVPLERSRSVGEFHA